MTRRRRVVLGVAAAAVALSLLAAATSTPSMDRTWAEDLRILARAELTPEGLVRLADVRDWRYAPDSVVSRGYRHGEWVASDVREIWLYAQEFDDRGLTAHTFLVFEFDGSYGDQRYLGISMEARREEGESYSIVRGLLRGFEAAVVWATEEDLVSRRAVYAGAPVKRFRLVVEPETRAAVFRGMVKESRALEERPRWYNTALFNCTNILIREANRVAPGAIPLHYSWVLTGRVDEYLERLGFLDPDATRTFGRDDVLQGRLRPAESGTSSERTGGTGVGGGGDR
jgi:hypothetical protein